MSDLRNPTSAEARALERARPDLHRVAQCLRVPDMLRQAVESWDRHAETDDEMERSRLVAVDLDITGSDAPELLEIAGAMTAAGFYRRIALSMFQDGANVDHVREELQGAQNLIIELAIGDLAADLVERRPDH